MKHAEEIIRLTSKVYRTHVSLITEFPHSFGYDSCDIVLRIIVCGCIFNDVHTGVGELPSKIRARVDAKYTDASISIVLHTRKSS